MSGIWKINMVQNFATKDDFNKLSFKKGDSFVARVLKLDSSTSEVIVRLLDGRTFPAKIEGIINEPLDNYLLKFLIQDIDDGKINLKILERGTLEQSQSAENKGDLLKDILERINFPIDKKDVGILKDMLKFNIPVNEENFTEIKSLKDFMNKIRSNPGEEEVFIEKYLSSKGIDTDSERGSFIRGTLKNFFSEAKKLDLNGFFVMKESKLEFTEQNLKSFNKVTSPDFNIFNEIEGFSKEINSVVRDEIKNFDKINNNSNNINSMISGNSEENTINKQSMTSYGEQLNDSSNKSKISNDAQDEKVIHEKTLNKENLPLKNREGITNYQIKTSEELSGETALLFRDGKQEKGVLTAISKELSLEQNVDDVKKHLETILNKDGVSTEVIVKEEIKEKIGFLKNMLSGVLKNTEDTNMANRVFQNLESKLQDFKMFNTLNNDYYYLNVPMDVREDKYDCKLVIKDERSSGKKLDSKNIKIAASISTLNMKTVDAYITVINNNTSIEIHAEEKYVKILDILKHKLLKELETLDYRYNISVEGKKEEFSLVNCREFFADKDFNTINRVV
jgi:hypothetical protein